MIILFLLGFLSFGFTFLNSYVFFPLNQDRKLLRIIISIILCLSFVWATTEFLSLFNLIAFPYILTCWILFILFNFFIFRHNYRAIRNAILPTLNINVIKASRIRIINIAFAIFIAFQIGVLSYLAYSYPPNNWDSMTYHMARVMHWSQNQSISPYPTNILRQIQLLPFAEYQILSVYTLTGNDYFVNFVQLIAFCLCLICVAEITDNLKTHQNQVISSIVLSASLPMAILQATSTQNDLVASSLQASFVAIGLTWIKEDHHIRLAIPVGLSLGLALLTKATTMVFLLPFCVYFGYMIVKRFSKKAIIAGPLVGAILLAVNIGYWARNYEVFGSPTGPSENYINDIRTIDVVFSNLIRNTALNYLPYKDGGLIINKILNGVLNGLNALHSNISSLGITDPRTSWTNWDVFTLSGSFHEDTTGNPLHTTLIIFAFIIFGGLIIVKKKSIEQHYYYGLCVISGIFLFSWFLKWQPWGSRLELPFFILAIPFVSSFLFRQNTSFYRYAGNIVLIVIAAVSLLWSFNNATRPFLPYEKIDRTQAFFANIPSMELTYFQMVNSIPLECKNIGLAYGDEGYEYPIWVILKQRGFQGRIDFVFVQNQSKVLMEQKEYCSIISMKALIELDSNYTLVRIGEYYIYNQNPKPK